MQRHLIVGATLSLLAMAGVAVGQESTPRPRQQPRPVMPQPRGPGAATPANPIVPDLAIPGLQDADFRLERAPLRAEGTFLVEQRGSMLKLPTGEWVFVFHRDAEGKRERPMVLAPSQVLQRMEQLAADRGTEAAFSVTGQVLAYAGVNFLLPTRATLIQPALSETPAEPEPARADAPAPASPVEDLDVQNLIRQLEAQREQSRGRGVEGPGRSAGARPADAATPIPEDHAIVRRRGRLVRSGDGQWSFTFDTGTGTPTDVDRPMILIPCQNLQRMESWAASRGDEATFEVSGRVLTYQGRNYLLPTMFQVYPANDLEPRQ